MSIADIVIRIAASVVIGAIVGLHREYQRNSAGFRTHMLVAIGSCIAMMTNEFLLIKFADISNIDVARMGSYVISGIGFLGAGSIIKERRGIRGLTTAAGLWVTACLGITAGAGFYWAAIIGSGFVFVIITVFKMLEKKLFKSKKRIKITIKSTGNELSAVLKALDGIGAKVSDIQTVRCENHSESSFLFTLTKTDETKLMIEVVEKLDGFEVISVKIFE